MQALDVIQQLAHDLQIQGVQGQGHCPAGWSFPRTRHACRKRDHAARAEIYSCGYRRVVGYPADHQVATAKRYHRKYGGYGGADQRCRYNGPESERDLAAGQYVGRDDIARNSRVLSGLGLGSSDSISTRRGVGVTR